MAKMDDATARYRAFVRAADLGSFTKAAHELRFSQSAMSRMISALEAEWGVSLLERSRAGVCLTAEGAALLPAARALVAAQDEFALQVDGLKGLATGHVRIGTFSSVATHWLPKVIGRFRADYPRIGYELVLGDYAEIEDWVMSGRVDCGFTCLPAARGLAAAHLADDELLAVLPPEHRLATLDAVPAEELVHERFLLLEKDGNTVVDEAFSHCGGVPSATCVTWDDYSIMAMVESGLGVSVLPSLVLRRIPYNVALRPLARPVFRRICLVTRKAAAQPTAVGKFLEYLEASLPQL